MNRGYQVSLLLVLLLFGGSAAAQWHLSIRLGLAYGGPIPTQSDPDSSNGSGLLEPCFGLMVTRDLGERWQVETGLIPSLRGARYGQLFRRDTLMPIEILPGVRDTVPTYYVGNVQGSMSLAYLELPLWVHWRPSKRWDLVAGPYLGLFLGGADAGTIDIQIGDGTLFEDTTLVFDNVAQIQRLDHGIYLGGAFRVKPELAIEWMAQRSTRGLYRKGFLSSQGLAEVALYHTQFAIGLRYTISLSGEH